jgi:hypothetical protein
MPVRFPTFAVALALALSVASLTSPARAVTPERDVTRQDDAARDATTRDQKDRRHPVALTMNPLGFVIQRYGGNLEYSFVPHHAATASLYVQSVPVEMVRPFASGVEIRDRAAAPSFGGEIGYRLYSGRGGAEGLFIGGSFVAMPIAYPRLGPDFGVELERVYGTGGAIDIGAQTVTSFGLTIGGGLGASFLAYDMPNDLRRLPFAMPNVLPRLLLQTGYSF